MDKMIEFLEKRIRITGEAYERSHSVQWLRRRQEAECILAEVRRGNSLTCRK
jgi:hypothetical protein